MINTETQFDWHIGVDEAGERLDKFIADLMDEGTSRTQIQQWIKNKCVKVNDRSVKANYRLQLHDDVSLSIPPPEEVQIRPESIHIDIVYEDSDVVVVNKQRGMVVHPAPGHYQGTLVNALLYHCQDLSGINGWLRPGVVHRIDKDTSGLLMAAKNDNAHLSLAEQLKSHTVTRQYLAIVHGNVVHDQGTIDAPIGRDSRERQMMTVTNKNSKHAVTHFVVQERFGDYTLLQLKLETGRTHQIRVHMKFIGHPLVGDPKYGTSKGLKMDGQALHAAVLGFTHPVSSEYLEFNAPLPSDMEELLLYLRKGR